jgi:hypothetical protein
VREAALMPVDLRVDGELNRLRSMPVSELRSLWRRKFRSEPPKAFGPDLLRRSIAYQLQETAFGGLDRETAHLLKKLMAQYEKTPGKLVLPRRIKAGAVLTREWKGKSYRVTVVEDGFSYGGHTYATLSEVARLITGTRWNGPRFFGLRAKEKG